jgi:hypothetical protein
MSDPSTDPVFAKQEASRLWLGHVPNVEAVGLGRNSNGNQAIIVLYRDTGIGPPNLPDVFRGVPVILQPLTGPVRPL